MHDGCILDGKVGSGKTITSVAYFYSKVCGGDISKLYSMNKPMDLYVITTAKKRDSLDWEDECKAFGIFSDSNLNQDGHKFVVDSWHNVSKYTDVTNAFFIFDEQKVVSQGKWVKSFLKISKSNGWILLSGTPGDTWSDYAAIFVANRYYKNLTQFRNEHIVYNRFARYPQIDHYVGIKKLERLRKEVLVPMDDARTTVRHYNDISVEFDEETYNRVHIDRWNIFSGRPVKDAGECCILERKIVNSDPGRLDVVVSLVAQHPRVIIFYNFDAELELLRLCCKQHNWTYAEWNGHKHQPIPKSESWVYLAQYAAAAESWNCIETDTIIFYTLNYSYKIMEQASGRIDRLNTPYKDLYYYRIVSKAPIDKAIWRSIKRKKLFNERAYFKSFYD